MTPCVIHTVTYLCNILFPYRDSQLFIKCYTDMCDILFRFVVCMVYYGLGLGVNLLGGNIFLNAFMSGAIEIPSYIIVIPIMNKLGRRWTTVVSLVVASVACFICTTLLDKEGLSHRIILQHVQLESVCL